MILDDGAESENPEHHLLQLAHEMVICAFAVYGVQKLDWVLGRLLYEFPIILFYLPASPHLLQKSIYEVQDFQQDEQQNNFLPMVGHNVGCQIEFRHNKVLDSFPPDGPDKFRLFLFVYFH